MPSWVKSVLTVLAVLAAPALESADQPELSLDFLEFLSEWEAQDGEWLDPHLQDAPGSGTGNAGEQASESGNKQ